MMFEAMIMELVLFFAGLFAVLAFVFVGLRKVGVSSDRIGSGTARVVHVLEKAPGVHRLLALSRRHRKTVGWVGALLAICIAPFALMGVLVVVGSVAAVYAFGHLSQFVDVEDEGSKGSGYDFDGYSNDELRRQEEIATDEEAGLYDGEIWSP